MSSPQHLWDTLISRFKGVSGGTQTFHIAHYPLTLGAYDATTGWPILNYSEIIVEGIIVPKSSSWMLTGTGFYCRYDAVAFSKSEVSFSPGDIVARTVGMYYEVIGKQQWTWGDISVVNVYDLVRRPTGGINYYGFEAIIIDVSGFSSYFERSISPMI